MDFMDMKPLIEKFSKLSTPSRAHLLLKLNEINTDKKQISDFFKKT